jgi:hypothetical protein
MFRGYCGSTVVAICIVADVSADTVVDPEVNTVIHCRLFRGYCDSSVGCIGGYSGGSSGGYSVGHDSVFCG